MDLSAAEVQQRAEADRREVDPPIQGGDGHVVKLATLIGGERTAGMVGSGTRCRRPATVGLRC